MQLSWGQILSHGDFDTYCSLLKALFARFGYIIHRAYPNVDNSVLDDPQYMTQIPSDNEESVFFITTRKFIRQMVSIFLALFRAIFIISSAEIAPVVSEEMHAMIKAAFKNHHVESSLDFFNHLQQVICLAPGMRLVYRTNFAGMYNDISQVMCVVWLERFLALCPSVMAPLPAKTLTTMHAHRWSIFIIPNFPNSLN